MSRNTKVNILSLSTIILWSIAFPFTKVAMKNFSANSLAFTRVCIAAVVLLVIGMFSGISLPKKKDVGWLLLSGACGFGGYLFMFNMGLKSITSASSSIIIALTPIFTAIQADIFYREKINRFGWICMISAFIGVLIMMLWDGVFSVNTGMIWTLMASVLFSIYNILNRKFAKEGYKAIEIVTYSMFSAILCLLPFMPGALREIKAAPADAVMLVIMLGTLCSAVAYYLWGCALSLTDNTSKVTNYSFMTPLFATILGSVVLSEIPNMGTVIGGIVIIISIILFSKRGSI